MKELKEWLEWLGKMYLLLLVGIFVFAVILSAAGNPMGEQLLRNGFFYAVAFPIAFALAAIGWAFGVAHNSGVVSGPQLLPILLLVAFAAVFFGLVRGLFKKASSSGGGHKPH